MRFLRQILLLLLISGLSYSLFLREAHAQLDTANFGRLDPKGLVPARALSQAVAYLTKYANDFQNQNYLVVIDFSQHSSKKRFYLVNLRNGDVEPYLTAHGSGSDSDGDGWANRFSNAEGSKASSLGFYRTLGTYSGKWGYSMLLQGLSSTNSNAYDRAIVVHGASYVSEKDRRAGRSWGCPALDMSVRTSIINRIKGGALMYAWQGQ